MWGRLVPHLEASTRPPLPAMPLGLEPERGRAAAAAGGVGMVVPLSSGPGPAGPAVSALHAVNMGLLAAGGNVFGAYNSRPW